MMFTGGLAVFLFGLNYMREALLKINGARIKKFIIAAAGNKFKALITGIVITALIQSSSGVTAFVIALISSGLMTLPQGIMVMIGANIGTTTTAFIFTLQIENYCFIIIFIGFILGYFRNINVARVGNIIVGFGFLFLGIYIMNFFYEMLAENKEILNYFILFSDNRFSAFTIGALVSALIQSSSGTINFVQNLYAINALSLTGAIGIMLGANLGTTVASLIYTVSSTKEVKTAININIIFNLIGGIIFLIILHPFCSLLQYIRLHTLLITNDKIMIAYSHLFYNVATTIIFYVFYEKIMTYAFKTKTN